MVILLASLLFAGCGAASKHTATPTSPAPPSIDPFKTQVLTLSKAIHLSGRISSRRFSRRFVAHARVVINREARRTGWGRVTGVGCVGAVVLTGHPASAGRVRIRGAVCNGVVDHTCMQWVVNGPGGALRAFPWRACRRQS